MAEIISPARVGGGYIDYTDNDYPAGNYLTLLAGQTVQLSRDLQPNPTRTRLNPPWSNFAFWDNTTKLIKARAQHDTFDVSAAVRIVSDKIGGVLRIQLMTADNAFIIAAESLALTSNVGEEEGLTTGSKIAVGTRLAAVGAKIMLTCTVNATLREFSPIFYPTGYDA